MKLGLVHILLIKVPGLREAKYIYRPYRAKILIQIHSGNNLLFFHTQCPVFNKKLQDTPKKANK